jgi:signal peptidase I
MRTLVRTIAWIAVVLGIVIGVARATAIRWWRVPQNDPYLEASIAPTLRGGDLVILWRLTPANRGDLVLCPEPGEENAGGDRIVIGRVVALGGDKVEIKKAKVHVNGEVLPTDSTCPTPKFTTRDPETDVELSQHCSLESIGSNVHMVGGAGTDISMPLPHESTEVNDGQAWLASDNRMLPYDSRDYGAADLASCTETIVFRLVSERGYFDTENRLTLIH